MFYIQGDLVRFWIILILLVFMCKFGNVLAKSTIFYPYTLARCWIGLWQTICLVQIWPRPQRTMVDEQLQGKLRDSKSATSSHEGVASSTLRSRKLSRTSAVRVTSLTKKWNVAVSVRGFGGALTALRGRHTLAVFHRRVLGACALMNAGGRWKIFLSQQA